MSENKEQVQGVTPSSRGHSAGLRPEPVPVSAVPAAAVNAFTPGPWWVHWYRPITQTEPYQIIGADGERVTRWGAFIKPSQDRAAANARLIAAAPDLFEALGRIIHNTDHGVIQDRYVEAARAALAKARGVQP